MTVKSKSRTCEVLVVGAGLAGLVASLQLQREGRQVLLIDRRNQVGGLCGTFTRNGHEFVIGCNDFGAGLVALLRDLGVAAEFVSKKTLIYYDGSFYNAQPDLQTIWTLRRHWRSILSLAGSVMMQQLPYKREISIEAFVDRCVPPGLVNDLAKVIPYFMGVPPYDMKTHFFGLDKKYAYGYRSMACPVGGPQRLADAIAEEFVRQGGTIHLCTRYIRHTKKKTFVVDLEVNGKIEHMDVDTIIDTTERTTAYPPETKRGLPLSMMCLALDRSCVYPEDVHTLVYYQSKISRWFGDLDEGTAPPAFGFHIFCSDLPPRGDCYTMNACFYLPRGKETLTAEERTYYEAFLITRMEEILPGCREAVRYLEIVTPRMFEEIHGLSSRVMPFIWHAAKPSNQGRDPGHYYAGHTVTPPGEHAGAAALSGLRVAQAILNS
jgi:phytoene dehydrogenase-like protein